MHVLHFFCLALLGGPEASVEQISVNFKVPALKANPYHKPYVAVWVESENRAGVKTLLVWHEGKDWLKDLRQWWRKLGRDGNDLVDGVSGATQKPGSYRVQWDGLDSHGKPVQPGIYYINIEAVRENGGRDFHRQKVILGQGKAQNYAYAGRVELSEVTIIVR